MAKRQQRWCVPLKVLDLNSRQIHLNLKSAAVCHFRQTLTDLIGQQIRLLLQKLTTKGKVYGQVLKKKCTTNPLFAFILCSSSFPSKSITVINRKRSPPKIKSLGYIAVRLSQAVKVFLLFLYPPLLLNPALHIPIIQIAFVILKADHFYWLWTQFECMWAYI